MCDDIQLKELEVDEIVRKFPALNADISSTLTYIWTVSSRRSLETPEQTGGNWKEPYGRRKQWDGP